MDPPPRSLENYQIILGLEFWFTLIAIGVKKWRKTWKGWSDTHTVISGLQFQTSFIQSKRILKNDFFPKRLFGINTHAYSCVRFVYLYLPVSHFVRSINYLSFRPSASSFIYSPISINPPSHIINITCVIFSLTNDPNSE